jgi:uncharacterized metal-binding protein
MLILIKYETLFIILPNDLNFLEKSLQKLKIIKLMYDILILKLSYGPRTFIIVVLLKIDNNKILGTKYYNKKNYMASLLFKRIIPNR